MCGITGIVRRDGAQIERELLTRMNDAIWLIIQRADWFR